MSKILSSSDMTSGIIEDLNIFQVRHPSGFYRTFNSAELVDFRDFDHLVLVEPYTGCCLRSPGDIGIYGEGHKQQIAAHAYPNGFIKD
jgi:hypothetical protein